MHDDPLTTDTAKRFNSLVRASIDARAVGSTSRAKELATAAITLAGDLSRSDGLGDVIAAFDSGFLSPLSVAAVRKAVSSASDETVRFLAESKLAQVHYFTHGEYDHARRWAESAASSLQERSEHQAASRAFNRLALIHYHQGALGEAQDVAKTALAESVELGFAIDSSLAQNTLSKITVISGNPIQSILHSEKGLLYAEEARSEIWIVANLFAMAMAQFSIGRLDEACATLDKASGFSPKRPEVLLASALVNAFLGKKSEALENLEGADKAYGNSTDRETSETYARIKLVYWSALARLGVQMLPAKEACQALAKFAIGPASPHIRLSLVCAYGEAAAVSGDVTEVIAASKLLSSFDQPVAGGELRPPILVGRIRTDLAIASSKTVSAGSITGFRSSSDASYPLESRVLETQQIRLQVRNQMNLDRSQIRGRLDRIREWIDSNSARGLESLLNETEGELKARRGGRPLYPAGLTEREVQVLRLLVRGLTNRQIADKLTISAHTVGQHLRNVYEKTGSSNRAQAGAFARNTDLIDPRT